MWFRFLVISVIKWFVFLIISSVLLQFVVPSSWSGYEIAAPMWLIAFLVAFAFAEWAFHRRMPEHSDTLLLFVIWMVVTLTLQLLHAQYVMGSILYVINSPDIYVQYLLEILAIFLASHLAHKRMMRGILSEGIEE
jgi:hypothetical protein